MMYLDRPKAKKLLKAELAKGEKITEASVALAGDEFCNNETIYDKGKFKNRRYFKCFHMSYWATPILIINYEDGKEKRLDCYFTEEKSPKRAKEVEKKVAIMRKKLHEDIEKMHKSICEKKVSIPSIIKENLSKK